MLRALWTGGPVTRPASFYPLEDAQVSDLQRRVAALRGPAGFDPGIMTDGSDDGGGDGAEVDPTSDSSGAGESGQDGGSMPESGDNAFGGETGG